MDNPKKAIAKFFDGIAATTVADEDRKGCFMFNTALEISAHDEQVNEIVINGIREIEAFFRPSIEVGQARGDMPKGLDPQATAKALLALIVAIRVLGRGVFAEAALQSIADEGKRLIGQQPPHRARKLKRPVRNANVSNSHVSLIPLM